ncbi:hypothetical protein [Streptomyces sp. Root369]|uniref:hypothetical protein n=1 Tax=Streptomyces sp. Root369 TaxID=1736523 RepID=UPI0018FF1110|nr:hypothetical protein [Streptomyces sp. Root369]
MFNPSRDDYDEIAYRELCPQGAELMDGRLSSCLDYEDPNYVGEYWPNKMAFLIAASRWTAIRWPRTSRSFFRASGSWRPEPGQSAVPYTTSEQTRDR